MSIDLWPYPMAYDAYGATQPHTHIRREPPCALHTALRPPAHVRLRPSPNFFRTPNGSKLLAAAATRYHALAFDHGDTAAGAASQACALAHATGAPVTGLSIVAESLDEAHPQLDTDESYSLSVPAAGGVATLRSATVFGALRGLETFSQLVVFDYDCDAYRVAPVARLDDAPRFRHRGLMLDAARHFLPLASIRAIVDSLAYAKLNVFHWHMSDSQSFPFQSTTSPKLWQGSFSKAERYTQRDVASIVEYARLRGVRVYVEFDVPGHSDAWCVGYPGICPSPSCTSPLNVAAEETFDRLGGLLDEVTGGARRQGLFPDDFLHLGGDEVNTRCWTEVPAVRAWLAARNMSADAGYEYFVKRAAALALARGRRPVQWSEVYDHFKAQLPKETVVHVWKALTNVTEVLADGYSVLRNVGYDNTSWYLDNLNVTWRAVYANEPCDGVPDALCAGVLGGQGEMWGETVDASDLEQTVWPRLAAVAEKLWSPRWATTVPSAAVEARLARFRCLLLRRGVRSAPLGVKLARSAPLGPGGCAV